MKAHLVSCIALFLAGGCAVGPDFHAPAAPTTSRYTYGEQPARTVEAASGAAGAAQSFAAAEAAPRTWWTEFGSDTLNRLVDEALRRSPTLDAARARLVEAQESYRSRAGETMLPAVDASFSATRQKIDPASFGLSSVPSAGPFTLYDASVSVSYLFDVFGANRRALEAMRADVDYDAYELEAARLALAGNVVASAIRRASLQAQIALTKRLERQQVRQLEVTVARQAAGGVSEFDVRAQRILLAQTSASLPPLALQLAQSEHRLAVLIGVPPAEANLADIALDALRLPETVPLTLPSTLARERPDIRAAEALLHRASANIGVATANLYPQFSVTASAGSQRTHIVDILDSFNVWSLGARLTQPLFHGGALRSQRRAAIAAYDAALGDYRQTVLGALQQVADTLRALESDARTLREREGAAGEAQANADIAGKRYGAGGIGQLQLIDAQEKLLSTLLERTKAQADRLADTAALYQALGGIALGDEATVRHDAGRR